MQAPAVADNRIEPGMRPPLVTMEIPAKLPESGQLVEASLERARHVAIEIDVLAKLPKIDLAVIVSAHALSVRAKESSDFVRDIERAVMDEQKAIVAKRLGVAGP